MGGMLRVFCDERYVERVLYDGRCVERERECCMMRGMWRECLVIGGV